MGDSELQTNPVLKEILESGLVSDGKQQFPLFSNISSEGGRFLQELIKTTQPKTSLEIGFAYGVSTLYICDALAECSPGATHHIFDPWQSTEVWKGIGLRNVCEAGYRDLIDFQEVGSEVALPRLAEDGTRLQFAFVDGMHTFDHVMMEFFYLNKMLDVGGIIAFDDVDSYQAIQRVLRHVLTYPAYEVVRHDGYRELPPTFKGKLRRRIARSQLGSKLVGQEILSPDWQIGIDAEIVAVKKIAEDDRNWDWHVEF